MKKALLFILSCILVVISLSAQRTNCINCTYEQERNPKAVVEAKEVKKSELTIYPNPTTDFIGVKNTDSNKVTQITIYNLVGKKMKNFPVIEGKKYYIADLPEGLYLVQMIGADAKVIRTQRMTKR